MIPTCVTIGHAEGCTSNSALVYYLVVGEFNARVGCGVGGDPWDDVCGQQCGVRLAAWATNQTLSDETPPVCVMFGWSS